MKKAFKVAGLSGLIISFLMILVHMGSSRKKVTGKLSNAKILEDRFRLLRTIAATPLEQQLVHFETYNVRFCPTRVELIKFLEYLALAKTEIGPMHERIFELLNMLQALSPNERKEILEQYGYINETAPAGILLRKLLYRNSEEGLKV